MVDMAFADETQKLPVQLADGTLTTGIIDLSVKGNKFLVTLSIEGWDSEIIVQAPFDWEAAALQLRAELGDQGILLGINRFSRKAYSSGMSRRMSEGLICYHKHRNLFGLRRDKQVETFGPCELKTS